MTKENKMEKREEDEKNLYKCTYYRTKLAVSKRFGPFGFAEGKNCNIF